MEGVGNSSATQYMLSSKVYSIKNNKAGYTRQRGRDALLERELILSHLNQYNKITREDVAELCRCTQNHASWLFCQFLLVQNKVTSTPSASSALRDTPSSRSMCSWLLLPPEVLLVSAMPKQNSPVSVLRGAELYCSPASPVWAT